MIEATIRAQVELQYALDRMSTPLHASRLSDATAAEDARCMAIIRAEIDRLRAALQHESDCVEAANAEIDRLTRERDEARARCIGETRALVTQREDLASRAAQYMQERDEARAECDALRTALNTIARTPAMPFPDPGAHSERAYHEAVFVAWSRSNQTARAALAQIDQERSEQAKERT